MAYHFDSYDESLVIDGWEKGIADSPFSGLSDMRNVNIMSVPGEVSVNFQLQKISQSASGSIVSADPAADTVTVTGVPVLIADGGVIIFSGGPLPGGIVAGTPYLIGRFTSGNTFHLYLTYALYVANTPVDITSSTNTGTYASILMGKPTQRFFDRASQTYYIIDWNGRVWAIKQPGTTLVYLLGNDALTTSEAPFSGNGVIAYRGYLFAFRDHVIDYMVIATGVWTYAWNPTDVGGTGSFLNTPAGVNNPHYALLNTNDRVYYTDAGFVGAFTQNDGTVFNPATPSTYTWSRQAVALPSNDIANCLAELGTNLLIGGQANAIYPWDRLNTFTAYPILLAENFIQRMCTVNTNTYILAGQRGRIYVTNGSQATLFKKVPDHISGTVDPYFQWGDLASFRNQLYFGIEGFNANSGPVFPEYGGVWAIDLDVQAIRLANKMSYGTYNGLATVLMPLQPSTAGSPQYPTSTQGIGLLVGWDSGVSTYGIDYSASVPYANGEATIDSDLIPIGTYDKPRDFTRVEYRLSKALVTGESIIIKYRLLFDIQDQTSPPISAYAVVLTDNTAGNYSLSGPVNFKNAQWVQFQVVLTSLSSTNPYPSFVRLREIRIRGLVGPTMQGSQQLSL